MWGGGFGMDDIWMISQFIFSVIGQVPEVFRAPNLLRI